jgi:hypothetical protein
MGTTRIRAMTSTLLRSLAVILAMIFAWAPGAKVLRFGTWRAVLAGYRLPPLMERVARVAVPATELTVAGLLIGGETRAGAALSVALLSSFCFALVRARALQGDRLPCGCFGARKERDYRALLLRNAALALLPATLLAGGRDVSLLGGVTAPRASDLLPSALAVFGVAVIAWTAREVSVAFRKGRS